MGEKVKVLDLIRKGKKVYAEVYSKNKSSTHEIVKKEKEMHADFAATLHTAKVRPQHTVLS